MSTSVQKGSSKSSKQSNKKRSKQGSRQGSKRRSVEAVLNKATTTEDETVTGKGDSPELALARSPKPVADPKTTSTSSAPKRMSGRSGLTITRPKFKRRIGGVAPFVSPKNRLGRAQKMREWNRRGFVPLSPAKQKLRHRILPRTVIGIATMLMAVGIGAAFAGASFYAYYDNRLAENERTVARFVEGFDQQFTDAAGALDEMRTESIGEIRDELLPLQDYVADANGVIGLPTTAGPSVWLVETRDENGEIISGSAFALVGHQGGTALVTSYSLVQASTTNPSPGLDLLKGNERIPAQLWAWDEERDLALVVVDREIPILEMAGENAQVNSVGARVFALSGVGGQGATASPGVLLDHSQVGLQHTAPVGTLFRGGPLLTGEGKVVGMASDNYQPFGVDPGDVRQAPDVRGICVVILECSLVKEEIEVEVVAEEAEAPPRGEEPVREIETDEDGLEEELPAGESVTIDPDAEPAPAEEGSDSEE